MCTVSVIIPLYNAERHVEETLRPRVGLSFCQSRYLDARGEELGIDQLLRIAATTAWTLEGIAEPLARYRLHDSASSSDLDQLLAAFELAVARIARYAPDLVERHGARARSHLLRYVARRGVHSRDPRAVWYIVRGHRDRSRDPAQAAGAHPCRSGRLAAPGGAAGAALCPARGDAPVLDRLEAARPDLLIMAMGVPRQELFLARHRARLDAAGVRIALAGGLSSIT